MEGVVVKNKTNVRGGSQSELKVGGVSKVQSQKKKILRGSPAEKI